MRQIHTFREIGPKSRDQLEDICVVWGMIKNDRDRNISRLSLRLVASQKNKTQTHNVIYWLNIKGTPLGMATAV